MSNAIVISDGMRTIRTARNLNFTINRRDVTATTEMADKSTVMDMVGYKYVLTIPPGVLSTEQMMLLLDMVYRSRLVTITFPDILGEITRKFILTASAYAPATWDANGVLVWKPPTITATQQGVEK
jgi:hypothetical protein